MKRFRFICYTHIGGDIIGSRVHEADNDTINELGGIDYYIEYLEDRYKEELEEEYNLEYSFIELVSLEDIDEIKETLITDKINHLMRSYRKAIEDNCRDRIVITSNSLYSYLDALLDTKYITKEKFDEYLAEARKIRQ